MKPLNPTIHTHHWTIDRYQHGTCDCGATKAFPLPGVTWLAKYQAEHKGREARMREKENNGSNT